jgi:antitoxin ParD1/3/4
VNVTLTPELERFVQAQVESGRYLSGSDVISAALRSLQEQQLAPAEQIEPLHARVDDALLSLTRGEGQEGEAYVENPGGRLEESQEDERGIKA